MAYYAYKNVRDLIPDEFRDEFIKEYEKSGYVKYEGDSNYDGDMWYLTANYIEYLQSEIKRLENASTTN